MPAAARPHALRLATASAIGTTLEWYDFVIYNVMAALIFNRLFFPSFAPLTGTLLALSTYAVGYLSRPFGGMIFGHLGDRYGRRFVLVATLLVVGLATCLIGALPTYAQWGAWSPMLLVGLRFLQGAALGGEWAGAVLISIEHGPAHRRGWNGCFAQIGPACGTLLGTGVVSLTTLALSPAAFESWGWRIPFWCSAVLVSFGWWVRRRVQETPVFMELAQHHAKARTPVADILRRHTRPLLLCIGTRFGSDICYSLLVVYTLSYLTGVLHLDRALALVCTMIGAVCNALAIPLAAALSDRLGRRRVSAAGAIASSLWLFAYFPMLDSRAPGRIALAIAVGLTLHGALYGPQAAFIAEQFPGRVRYAGSSLAYTLTGTVAGGIAPLIFAALYQAFASTTLICLYVVFAFGVTLASLRASPETAFRPLS